MWLNVLFQCNFACFWAKFSQSC